MRIETRLTLAAAVMTLLASLCLVNVFLRQGWLVPAVGAVGVVAGAGQLARRMNLWRPGVPLVSAGALLCYLVLAFARDNAIFGVLPSAAAVRQLLRLGELASEEILTYAVPIGPLPGTTFLTVLGVAATALVVDTVAVTMRQVALSVIPLAGFYLVPLSVTAAGVPWAAFALTAGAYLTLLVLEARERVGGWGRLPGGGRIRRPAGRVETGPLAALGRRVGVAVVGAAVVIPVMVPGIDRGFLPGAGPGSGDGPNTISVINPILNLGQDLRQPVEQEVLRYRSSGEGGYLRIVGLDSFDGQSWEPSRLRVTRDQNLEGPLPTPEGLASDVTRVPVQTRLSIGPLDQKFLPVRYPAASVDVAGEWLYDRPTANIFSGDNDTSTRGLSYTVMHLDVAPTPEQLRAAVLPGREFSQFLDLPEELPEVVAATAREVTAQAGTAYDEALALQTWLRGPEFRYDINAPDAGGSSAVVEFLDQQRGYCIHFASTMAVMARTLGIPARVAVGFTRGRSVGSGDFTVTTHDAHAWPELYFAGAGWLAFEPTPSVRTGEPPPYAQGAAVPPPDSQATAQPSAPAAAVPEPQGADRLAERTGEDSADGSAGWSRLPVLPTVLVAAGIAAALVPALVGTVVRRRRWRAADADRAAGGAATGAAAGGAGVGGVLGAAAEAAWAEVRGTTRDLRAPWPSAETPRRSVDRLAADYGLDAAGVQALRRLALAIEQTWYAPAGSLGRSRRVSGLSAQGAGAVGTAAAAGETRWVEDLRSDAARVRAAMLAGSSRRARLRARLLPVAFTDVVRIAGRNVADGLDVVDRAVAAVGRRFKPHRG